MAKPENPGAAKPASPQDNPSTKQVPPQVPLQAHWTPDQDPTLTRGPDEQAERLKRLARGHADAAIAALADVMGNPEEQGSARAMAAKAILDRGFGAPERRTETKVDVTVVDQRAAHFAALQKLATRPQAPRPPIEELPRITGQPGHRGTIEDAEFEVVKRQ